MAARRPAAPAARAPFAPSATSRPTMRGGIRGGLQSLGKVASAKRAAPKPVALPSMRAENLGLDPTVKIVPDGGWGVKRKDAGDDAAAAAAASAGSTTTPEAGTSPKTAPKTWSRPSDQPPPASAARPKALNDNAFPSLGQEPTEQQQQHHPSSSSSSSSAAAPAVPASPAQSSSSSSASSTSSSSSSSSPVTHVHSPTGTVTTLPDTSVIPSPSTPSSSTSTSSSSSTNTTTNNSSSNSASGSSTAPGALSTADLQQLIGLVRSRPEIVIHELARCPAAVNLPWRVEHAHAARSPVHALASSASWGAWHASSNAAAGNATSAQVAVAVLTTPSAPALSAAASAATGSSNHAVAIGSDVVPAASCVLPMVDRAQLMAVCAARLLHSDATTATTAPISPANTVFGHGVVLLSCRRETSALEYAELLCRSIACDLKLNFLSLSVADLPLPKTPPGASRGRRARKGSTFVRKEAMIMSNSGPEQVMEQLFRTESSSLVPQPEADTVHQLAELVQIARGLVEAAKGRGIVFLRDFLSYTNVQSSELLDAVEALHKESTGDNRSLVVVFDELDEPDDEPPPQTFTLAALRAPSDAQGGFPDLPDEPERPAEPERQTLHIVVDASDSKALCPDLERRLSVCAEYGHLLRNHTLLAAACVRAGAETAFLDTARLASSPQFAELLLDQEAAEQVVRTAYGLACGRLIADRAAAQSTAANSAEVADPALRLIALSHQDMATALQTVAPEAETESRPAHAQRNFHLNDHERALMSSFVSRDQIDVGFDDIGSLDAIKTKLQDLISLPLQRPDLFSEGVLRQTATGVLLFGPPGTGKTLLAKAVARESGANFLHVSNSSLFNKYVGESEKAAKAVFTLAVKMSPCVIFIDEAESLLVARDSARSHQKEVLNEILQNWDGLTKKAFESSSRVTVLAATNLPQALDDAVLRRLPRRLHVPLPDADARLEILRKQLRRNKLSEDVDLKDVAARTKDFSGSDLHNVALAAALHAVKRLIAAEKQTQTLAQANVQPQLDAGAGDAVANTTAAPASAPPTAASTVDGNTEPGTTASPKVVLNKADFEHALKTLRPSFDGSSESSRARALWESRYGEASKGPAKLTWGFAIPPPS
eukprot:m.190359 g.190359  ORF g.190359 m.190359 type:complete len:1117 (-) comp17562_c2_seq6:44-3394(-)